MTSDRLARDYLRRARLRRRTVDLLMTAGSYPDVVRMSHDVVELVLKGALRFIGADPPKRHDVHRVLGRFVERFPPEWLPALTELREGLDRLAQDRGPAFYGDEEHDVPASDLFSEADARRSVAISDRLLDLYARLLGEGQP